MSCPVCICDFNKSTCSKVVCMCDYTVCRSCVRTYLLNTIQEPHCMKCRNKWSFDFVKNQLGASFVNGELKEHQKKILTEKSIAKREELMPLAIEYRISQNEKKKIDELKAKMSELREQMNAYQDQIIEIENVARIRNGEQPYYRAGALRRNWRLMMNGVGGGAAYPLPAPEPEPEPEPKKKFIMPCQNANCNGMLNNAYCCELCDKKTCSKCLEVEDKDHKCNPDTVESAKLLRNSTKPCPKCGTRISKIDGCDQMWCVECKTAFSWNKGTIETSHIHNPHYFEYMRNNNMVIARNPYEARGRCENRRVDAVRLLLRVRYQTEVKTKISRFIQYVNHIEGSTIVDLNNSIQNKTNNVQPLEINYLLGELTKDDLSDKLMTNHKCVLKDQAFKDIYAAIVMMGDQICGDIGEETTDYNYQEIWSRIVRFSAYFNMELIKALMLHDSKRTVDMFDTESNKTEFYVNYKSKKEMNDGLMKFSEIYNKKDKSFIGGGSEIIIIE